MARALEGLRVLEVGQLVGAAYATKLLADLGADVVKIEPPGAGDAARRRGPFPHGQPQERVYGISYFAAKHGERAFVERVLAAAADPADEPVDVEL